MGAFVGGDASALALGPGAERDRFATVLDAAIRELIDPDVEISNPSVFVLHRRRDDGDLYFIVNTTFQSQSSEIGLPGNVQPTLWDPTSGEQHNVAVRHDNRWTTFSLVLPPVGSMFVITGQGQKASSPSPEENPASVQFTSTFELPGPWTFEPEEDNALVVKGWLALPEEEVEPEAYAGVDVDEAGWQPVGAGAWAYQLPAEPDRPWPIAVWYRIPFEVDQIPGRVALLVDGFDGDDPTMWLNGRPITSSPVRSKVDAQMQEVELTDAIRAGRNVLAVRLILRDATGGIVDHVKLLGRFGVAGDDEHTKRMVASLDGGRPASWTEQGYPFFSGRGAYRTAFDLDALEGQRLHLEVPMRDDVLEIEINGQPAGIRLWDPYVADITDFAREGRNDLTLRVSNTLANLLYGVSRPSGLAGTPRLLMGRFEVQGRE